MVSIPRLIRFILVGGTSAFVQLGLTWLFIDGLGLQVLLGSSAALTLTIIYNYSLHYYWTFSSDAPHGWILIRYLLMCMGALIINALVMHYGVMLLPFQYLVVQCFAAATVVIWSFTLSSLWVFARES